MRRPLLLAVTVCLLVAACGYPDPGTTASTGGVAGTDLPTPTPSPSPSPSPGGDDFNAGKGLPVITLPDGLKYIDLVVGTGPKPNTGDTITVQYTGWLANGTKFDSSRDRGQPASFQIGTGAVIPGWDEAVITMRVGGKRKLIIPPELGYGSAGQPPAIPANATLVFEIELLSTAPTPSPSPSASP
ncbi:MAG TPA: FKBP-type peptidyl-prolyl cis-trans isomerase [Candidatus Dormibacteraeota bacterium]|nr:FKBP-type peptidyl-prolyl cis-trans isomerase [Candidatus Dormibacteraeota bacterium]